MTLRLIHVGLGGWGSDWAKEVVAKNKEVETVAWVELVPAALAQAQERLNLPQERCFATAAGADRDHKLLLIDVERDALQGDGRCYLWRHGIDFVDVFNRDHR